MNLEKLKATLKSGAPARLLPVLADSKKEERATSILLAAFTIVPDFAHAVLTEAGIHCAKTSRLHAFTEVTFKHESDRPDGLLILTRGKRTWSAIIEVKIGTSSLQEDQISRYLQLAKNHDVDE